MQVLLQPVNSVYQPLYQLCLFPVLLCKHLFTKRVAGAAVGSGKGGGEGKEVMLRGAGRPLEPRFKKFSFKPSSASYTLAVSLCKCYTPVCSPPVV